MLKRTLLLLIFPLLVVGMKAQDNGQIRVCWPDGSCSIMSFDTSCRLSYGEDAVKIITPGETVTFGYDEILKIDFIHQEASAISNFEVPTTDLHISDGVVIVSGIAPGTRCVLFDIHGKKLESITADGNSGISINLNSFADNIFVLLVGDHPFKIAK